VARHERRIVLGPNGSGKTTLMALGLVELIRHLPYVTRGQCEDVPTVGKYSVHSRP
jgi:type IV secretory pathway ATPase VirB11/archaellum biosynthesis ATPase